MAGHGFVRHRPQVASLFAQVVLQEHCLRVEDLLLDRRQAQRAGLGQRRRAWALDADSRPHLVQLPEQGPTLPPNALDLPFRRFRSAAQAAVDPLLLDGKKAELGAGTREGFRVLSDEWIERIQSIDNGRMFGELAGRVIREGAGSPRD